MILLELPSKIVPPFSNSVAMIQNFTRSLFPVQFVGYIDSRELPYSAKS